MTIYNADITDYRTPEDIADWEKRQAFAPKNPIPDKAISVSKADFGPRVTSETVISEEELRNINSEFSNIDENSINPKLPDQNVQDQNVQEIKENNQTTLPDNVVITTIKNQLDSYSNYTYHFQFYMINFIDLINFYSDRATATVEADGRGDRSYIENITNPKFGKTIIAESGATSGITIKDIEINNIVSTNPKTKNTTALTFKITLLEPQGMLLFDRLQIAAQNNLHENFQKAPYFLELSFRGWDENGNPKTILDEGMKKIWQVAITEIVPQTDINGTVYSIKAIVYDNIGYLNDNLIIPELIEFRAKNVQEAFIQLKKQLNSIRASEFGYIFNDSQNAISKIFKDGFYNFRLNSEFKKWTFQSSTRINSSRAMAKSFEGEKEGAAFFSFKPNTSINDIIDTIFSMTNEGQKRIMIMDDRRENRSGRFQVPNIYRLESQVIILGYDNVTNQYVHKIEYIVTDYPAWSARILTLTDEERNKDAKINQQKQIIQAMLDDKVLTRSYHYMFSGKNTDVLEFNLDLNAMWAIAIPNKTPLLNYDSTSSEYYKKLDRLRSDVSYVKNVRANLRNKLDGVKTKDESESRELALERMRESRDLAAQERIIQEQNIRFITRDTLQDIQATDADRLPKYIENIVENNRNFPISLKISAVGTTNITGQTEKPNDYAQSLFVAALNQIYKFPSNLKIDLEIRGDPYWLGISSLEDDIKRFVIESTNNIPNYVRSEHSFWLEYNPAQRVNDDTGFTDLPKNSMIKGPYGVIQVTSKFDNGKFTQLLTAIRNGNIDPFLFNIEVIKK